MTGCNKTVNYYSLSFRLVVHKQEVIVLRDVGLTSQSELTHFVEFELQFEHE